MFLVFLSGLAVLDPEIFEATSNRPIIRNPKAILRLTVIFTFKPH